METKNYFKTALVLLMIFMTSMVFAATAPVTVNAYDSEGNTIAAKFKVFKGPNYVGEYNTGTSVQLDVGATYKLFAHYQSTSTERVTFVVDPSGNTFNFSTTKITFHWTGGYLDYRGSGGWISFGKTGGVWNSRELFPKDFYGNTMKFHFGYKWNDPRSMIVEMDYSGQTSIEKVVSQLHLVDHNGNPLAGGTARGGYATPTVWFVPGSTNAQGLLLDMRDGSNTNLSYEMKFNKTTKWSVQQTGSIYDFQTSLITLRVETCDGTPINGAVPAFGYGTNGDAWWFPGGNTGTSADGESEAEIFPGTYTFRMEYKATKEYISSWNFPADGSTVTWTTTKVTLNYAGSISYGGSTGDSRWFTKPSMELLHGTYKFHFRGAGTVDLTLTGCEIGKSGVHIKLVDSNNNGLEGGVATYYKSGWHTAGTTDANGDIFTLIDGTATKYSFRMKYLGYSQQKSNVDITVTNPVLYQTVNMEVQLKDSGGNPLSDGVVTYYASGWHSFGTTDGTGSAFKELLPGKYSFRMKYLGYSQQKSNVNIATTNPLIYQTTKMEVQLKDSGGNPLSGGVVIYYASGWKSFGTTDGTGSTFKELLPGKYSFRMKYLGYSQQKSNVNIATTNPLIFQTVKMEVQLKSSGGNPVSGGVVIYYASGWHSFGTTDGTGSVFKELLPGKYSFRMKYGGYSQQKSNINITTTNPLVYQLMAMTVSLQTCGGTGLPGGVVTYYASGWKTFGTTDASGNAVKQLLPGKYSFRMKYLGQSNQKSNINITTTNPLIYNTTNVALNYNGTIKYYASGWKTFTQPSMEMLPHNYPFRFGSKQFNINVTGCSISKAYVLLTLLDENGNGVPGGKARPAYGGSWGATLPGQTDNNGKLFSEIPPGYTKIKMTVNQGSVEQLLAQLQASNYTWTTEVLRIWLTDHAGNPITDGTAYLSQGGGYWHGWGYLNSSGYMDIPLFARTGAYKFKISYKGTSNTKFPVVSTNTGIDNYYFSTGQVFGSCITQYAQGSWHTFIDGMELMPGSVHFRYPDQYATVVEGGTITLSCGSKSAIADMTTDLNTIYPNPFRNSVNLTFTLEKDQKVIIAVYDMRGALVKTLVNGNMLAGDHKIIWDSKDKNGGMVNQGVYVVKFITADKVDQKTIVKMR